MHQKIYVSDIIKTLITLFIYMNNPGRFKIITMFKNMRIVNTKLLKHECTHVCLNVEVHNMYE